LNFNNHQRHDHENSSLFPSATAVDISQSVSWN